MLVVMQMFNLIGEFVIPVNDNSRVRAYHRNHRANLMTLSDRVRYNYASPRGNRSDGYKISIKNLQSTIMSISRLLEILEFARSSVSIDINDSNGDVSGMFEINDRFMII